MNSSRISVGQQFIPYVDSALARVGYILPGVEINFDDVGNKIEVENIGKYAIEEVIKEINYALYREKIYHETLPLRSKILGD